jgi:hypothetical protein
MGAAWPMAVCDDPEFHYQFGIDLFIGGVVTAASQPAAAPRGD